MTAKLFSMLKCSLAGQSCAKSYSADPALNYPALALSAPLKVNHDKTFYPLADLQLISEHIFPAVCVPFLQWNSYF